MNPERDAENKYVQRRWHDLSIEAKRLLARSLEERAFLVLLWRLEFRNWRDHRDDPPFDAIHDLL